MNRQLVCLLVVAVITLTAFCFIHTVAATDTDNADGLQDDDDDRMQGDSPRRGSSRRDRRRHNQRNREERDHYPHPSSGSQDDGIVEDSRDDTHHYDGDYYDGEYYYNHTDTYYGNCTGCASLEAIREQKIEEIKRKILRKLRLKEPPKIERADIEGLPNIPQLKALFESRSMQQSSPREQEEDQSYTEKIVMMGNPPPSDLGLLSMRRPATFQMENLVYFKFDSDLVPNHIHAATLGVYLRRADSGGMHTKLLIYRLQQNSRGRLTKTLLHKRIITLDENDTEQWHTIDFKHEVHHWVRKPRANLGLEIQARNQNGMPLAIVSPANEEEARKRPFLEIKITEDANSRSKRMLGMHVDCRNSDRIKLCCRYAMTVDFDVIGWEFIIMPRQYPAFFCSGDCPFYYNTASTQSHLSKVTVDQQGLSHGHRKPGAPCCTPVQMSSIDMIYMLKNKDIHFGRLSNMVSERCGCN